MLIVRRVLRVLLMTVAAVIVVAGALAALTQTSWFRCTAARLYRSQKSGQYLNGQLSIQKIGGNLFSGIELENIELSMDGNRVVAVQSLALDYRVAELVTRGLSLDYIRLNKPVVYLRRDAEGWSIGRLLKKQAREADREGPKRPINIGDISISDGLVIVDEPNQNPGIDVPRRFERLDARVSFSLRARPILDRRRTLVVSWSRSRYRVEQRLRWFCGRRRRALLAKSVGSDAGVVVVH